MRCNRAPWFQLDFAERVERPAQGSVFLENPELVSFIHRDAADFVRQIIATELTANRHGDLLADGAMTENQRVGAIA